jgi:hypothetical protein
MDDETDVELSFQSPVIDAAFDSLVVFVDGVLCADLPVGNLAMPLVLGEGCVEDGSAITFLLVSEDGSEAARLEQQLLAFLGESVVLSNWTADSVLTDYMSAYVDALDGSPPAESPVSGTAPGEGDGKADAPQLPVVGNLGLARTGTSGSLLAVAALVALAFVVAARRTTRA